MPSRQIGAGAARGIRRVMSEQQRITHILPGAPRRNHRLQSVTPTVMEMETAAKVDICGEVRTMSIYFLYNSPTHILTAPILIQAILIEELILLISGLLEELGHRHFAKGEFLPIRRVLWVLL